MEPTEQNVRDDLAELSVRWPKLRPLISRLPDKGEVVCDASFFAAYWRSEAPNKTLVARALFDDPSLFRRSEEPTLTAPVARRVVGYLESMQSDPLRTGLGHRDDIPKPMSRLFGLDRAKFVDISNVVCARLWPSGSDSHGEWSRDTCKALAPLIAARTLTDGEADRLIREGLEAPASGYYFRGPGELDPLLVRNMLVYLTRLFDQGRDGGREQNLIPLAVAERFNIAPRCVPETLAVTDVLALSWHGCLQVNRTEDPLSIAGLFEKRVPGHPTAFWRDAIEPHLARNLATSPFDTSGAGMYGSSFRFNVSRAVGLYEGRVSRLEAFAPYYTRADLHQLLATGLPYWRQCGRQVSRRIGELAALVRAAKWPAIRLRDLANIICIAEASPDGAELPSVARFALGEPEPQYTGRMGPRGTSGRNRSAPAQPKPLPQLASLLRRLDSAAASSPGSHD